MGEAVFGLLGVVVGVLSAATTQWYFARRSESFAARSALRLVMQDLYTAQALIGPVRDTGAWGLEIDGFTLDCWYEHRVQLSVDLDSHEWKHLEGAVLGIRHLEAIRVRSVVEGRNFTNEELADFERIGKWVDLTIEILEAHVK